MNSKYKNGSVDVTIDTSNGTKTRSYEVAGTELFPESCDVKITDYCDAGCPYCHENSTKSGKHGSIDVFKQLYSDPILPPGIELAIGGGNPLSHPLLDELLSFCKDRGFLCNLTVNQFHAESQSQLVKRLIAEDKVKGVGLSVNIWQHLDCAYLLEYPNTIFHFIIGVHDIKNVLEFSDCYPKAKILLLGYKTWGRGTRYATFMNDSVSKNIQDWHDNIFKVFKQFKSTICFDNLAIKQLELRRLFSDNAWSKFYLGDDGSHTMYVDLVREEYAVNSTSMARFPIERKPISQCFQHIKQ